MKDYTKQVLAGLRDADWFGSVGKPFPDHSEFIVLKSWKEAIKHYQSIRWENVQIFTRNVLWNELTSISQSWADEWSLLVPEIGSTTDSLVEEKLARYIAENNLPADLRNNVRWDIFLIAMEAEYSDIHTSGFYLRYLEPIYRSGHFPCGWMNDRPRQRRFTELSQGQLIVY